LNWQTAARFSWMKLTELTAQLQAKMFAQLRQEPFFRVGASAKLKVNVPHCGRDQSNLDTVVTDGVFRSDLAVSYQWVSKSISLR